MSHHGTGFARVVIRFSSRNQYVGRGYTETLHYVKFTIIPENAEDEDSVNHGVVGIEIPLGIYSPKFELPEKELNAAKVDHVVAEENATVLYFEKGYEDNAYVLVSKLTKIKISR